MEAEDNHPELLIPFFGFALVIFFAYCYPIARSLAMNPDVMLFDEVTAALDPETVKEVLVTIKDLAAEGMTCILVTHEMGFARELADHIYFTDRGVIVEHGPPATFFENAQDPRTKEFLSQIL